jgi:hypothetical protein
MERAVRGKSVGNSTAACRQREKTNSETVCQLSPILCTLVNRGRSPFYIVSVEEVASIV